MSPVKGRVNKIVNLSKKSGDKPKPDGTTYHWNIMTVEVVTDAGKTLNADSFDKLEVGSIVSLTHDEQYNSVNAKLYKPNPQDDKLDEIISLLKEIKSIVTTGEELDTELGNVESSLDGIA